MYVDGNPKTKKALKELVASGKRVSVFAPGLGSPPQNGPCCVEGPYYPKPHTWYATVTIVEGVIVNVK